jgi:hypothetical protein
MTDESGVLPVSDEAIGDGAADETASEPTA